MTAQTAGIRTLQRSALLTVPVLLVLLPLFALALGWWKGAPDWTAIGLGAAGWLVALMLRGPVAAAVAKQPGERAALIVASASGPCEELVRLALVVLLLSGAEEALWAGFGWGAVEIVYTVVNALVIRSLLGRNDPQAVEARALLEAQGTLRADGPVWAFLERIGATLLHIGFTLLLVWQPWIVLATVPLHSAVNLGIVRLTRVSLPLAEGLFVALSTTVFALGAFLVL
ncbi:hypothetical protein ABGB12_12050 [Actinocorallia sp. B10E7]|uniref:hypothetical protein n=1 Tax=Actinocorallia sp. B10E7 TaxID=3153558 RepID=UPI00325F514C